MLFSKVDERLRRQARYWFRLSSSIVTSRVTNLRSVIDELETAAFVNPLMLLTSEVPTHTWSQVLQLATHTCVCLSFWDGAGNENHLEPSRRDA